MNILVIGGGGREHALSWKLAQSPGMGTVFVAPGNSGMEKEPKIEVTGIPAGDFERIAAFVKERRVSFVVVGPDQALADGAVDFFEGRGIAVFGPLQAAARIEWSKAYSKEVMREAGIATAKYETFTELAQARVFLQTVDWGSGWVVKADGLALGKGVVVCESREEALSTVNEFLAGGGHGEAGRRVVIEERLPGREASAFFLCDGERAVPLGTACDYKRIYDGDLGPNTGGMGAFSPADWAPAGLTEQVQAEVAVPLLKALKARGTPYKGTLFVGLMINGGKAKVVEFNARFGDPETQVLLPLLDEDLLPWLRAASEGRLDGLAPSGPRFKSLHGVHVVLAAAGYPGAGGQAVRKGDAITIDARLLPGGGSWERDGVKLFFAGVGRLGDGLCTNGGRVLGLTAIATSAEEARVKAYEWVGRIHFPGAQRRSDVGL